MLDDFYSIQLEAGCDLPRKSTAVDQIALIDAVSWFVGYRTATDAQRSITIK
jgi:hypothetical protein